jgi:predicted methyltransferase
MTHVQVPETILCEVATAAALVEGEAGVLDVIRVIARDGPVAVQKISRASEMPVPIVAAVCGELRKRGVVARERPARLTPLGRELFGEVQRAVPARAVCPSCDGREVVVDHGLADVEAQLTRVAAAAPTARAEIDQSHCTVDTKLRRVLFMHEARALVGKRVLLLGDDDLMSIAIDRVSRRYGWSSAIREVTIVDVDAAVLAYCRARLANAGFPVTLLEHDLRYPLPPTVTGRFETVFADPPYTPEGAELFLSRAAAAMAVRKQGGVFFCFGMKPPEQSLRIQTAIAGMGFVIRRLVRNFNDYAGAGTLAGTSHLYHLTSTNQTRPLITNAYGGRLYTGDKRRTRRYRCSSCGAVETVGQDTRWPTVGDIKARGCPRCGATSFRPLPRAGAPGARVSPR